MQYVLLLLLVVATPHLSFAGQQTSPWLQPEVLKAAGALQLTEEQLPQFRAAITDLEDNLVAATNKLLRQNNIADLERKLKSTTNRQFKKLDRQVGTFLTETQQPLYLVYRDKLKSQLVKSTNRRGGSSSSSLSDTEKNLGQTSGAHH
jgi:hypothetical protein